MQCGRKHDAVYGKRGDRKQDYTVARGRDTSCRKEGCCVARK